MKKTHTLHRLLSLVLCICMVLSLVPASALSVFAMDTAYPYAEVDAEAGTATIDGTLGGKTDATEEDLTALVNAIKSYLENGITTVIVTGSQPAKLLKDGNLIPVVSLAFEQLTYDYQDEKIDSYWGTVDLIYQDVTEIVEYEFYVCDVLKSITLPKVTTVGDRGFWACYYLETLTFGSVVTAINDNSGEVFYDLGYEIDGCNLALNCGQLQAATEYQPNLNTNTWWKDNEWKSITLTHTEGTAATCIAQAVCSVCGDSYGEVGGHTAEPTYALNAGDSTQHDATYSCCGATVTEAHTMNVTTGKCVCGADMTAIATVTDGTNTYYAADAATLNQAVTAILETGSRTFTVELPADAEAGMITTIRRAICDTEGVADGSIHLTLKGVTTIPGTTNWDGVAFGPGDIYDEAGEIVDQELVTQLASINLPDVTEIGAQAFYFCENLVSVSAPKAQTIGAQALGYTALTSVEFPELTTIPTDMFSGTWTLSSAKFPKVTTIEQGGLLVGAKFKPENNPTPFPLELTAEGNITFNGSNHFNIKSQNYSGKVDLVLNIDKKDQVTFNDDGTATWQVRDDLSYTFKSITFTCTDGTTNHSYTYTDNGDGTHDATCSACGAVVDNEVHTIENHVCIGCGAKEIVVSFNAGDYEWKTGDQINFVREVEGIGIDDCVFTATVAEDGTVTWTADKPFCWYGEGEQKLFAAPNNGWSIDYFVIPEDQSTSAKLDEADLVNGMWVGTPTTDTITFNMTHRMAKVTVNYEFAEGITADISELKVYSIAEICLFSTDDWSIKLTSAGQFDVWVTPYLDGNQFTTFIIPETYATGEDFIKISLSDGTVYEVKMNKAVTFEEGAEYTYKVVITADGAYLTCADECSFEYTANEDGLTHSKTCSKCGYVEIAAEAHTGGTATCTEKAVCDLCGASYGELDPYNHTDVTAVFEWPDSYSDYMEVYADLVCSTCGEEVDYFWVYGDAITVETLPGTDCKNPTVATCTLNDEYNGVTYTDTKTYIVPGDPHAGEIVNGFCSGCGGFEEAVWNEEDYVYEIYNAGQLYWYAQELNTNNSEIYVKLMKDIVIPENAPNWEPINASYAYFNGNFHTISGLKCIGGDAQYVGLFGMEGWWYEISNLHIDSSYFEGSGYVGAVVACMTNGGSITNCAVTNTTVQGDGASVGTLAGYLSVGSVVNCFVDANTLAGGYTNGYVTIENSYYLSETETEDGGKTAEQFASGEVAYLLQSGIAEEDIYDEDWNWIGSEQPHVWGQTVGQDAYPVLKGQKVYENLDCAGAVAGYANEIIIPEHSFVQGYCQVCGEPLGDAVLDGVTYVFGGVIPLRWYLSHVEVPTYWVAGDGYVYFDPAAKLLTLDNATVYSELWSSEDSAVYWKDDLVINFSGTNTMSANDHNNGIVILVTGAAVMNGIGKDAVLNIISGADEAARFGSLTVNSGSVSFVSKDSTHTSAGVSTVALTVAEGAVVNVTAGNANSEYGLSYGMATEKLHVDGTLNASYGFCVNERECLSCGVLCTELTGSGTINAVMLQLDQENMILNFTACGKAVLASNWKAMTEEEATFITSFTVAEGAILTIPEGVTLDLTGLPAENISIRGTILNNGTIICNHSVAEDDGDCTTDIPCLICHQPVIAGNDEHDWMDATCTTAKVCSFCGTTEGDALGHGTIEGFEYHQYSDYHEVWCTDCWEYSYQENHTYGEDHYCICGAPEMFTVTFMNGDEVWITDNRYYNTKIAYVGMNYPTKEGYSFSGWYTAEGDPIANGTLVMGDMVVYAGFRINTYNYTVEVYTMDLFGNYGEPVVTTEAAEFGSIVDLTGYQTGEHFYLDGENINSKLYATVPANDDLVMRVYVVRKSYDITWILNGCTVVTGIGSDLPTYLRYSGDLGEDGWHYVKMLLDVPAGYRVADYVDGNGNSIAKESYNGHDRLKFYVTGDMTIEVVLEKETFDVTWIVDGTEFKETYEYGQVPVFTGSTDKANAGCAVYTFAGWNKDIVAVTCSASYTAIYNESFHHSWDDATCTEPKTCSACGTTEGEPLGHKWIYICNEPDTCSVCGATKDSVRQHTGYEDDGICDYCGMVAVEISLMDTDQRYFVFGQTGKDLVISVPENGHRLYYGAINRRTGENLAEGCVNRDGTFTIAGSLLDGMRMILVEVDPVYIFTVNVNGGSITDALKQALDAAGMQYTETYHERVYYIRYAGSLLYTGSYMREGFTLVGYELDGVRYGIDDPYVISGDDCVINLIWECNHNWTDATCTEPKTCTSCGETEGEALGHSYENNICTVCGSENVPVKLETAALSFQEKIHYNIFFSLNLSETVELADMGLVMFDSLNADGTVEDAIATYSGAVEMNGMYMVATDGVHAKCMGDTIYFRAYAKLADGSYVYSKTVEYSAVTYADHILNGDYSDSDKALVVAMLNYGAAAQMFFGYNTDNLVNTFLTDEQKALPEQYRDDMANTVPVVAAEKQGIFANNKGFNKRAPAVSFEGAFEINYFFTPAYAPVDGITLYYWTEADFEANEVLTVDNATGSLKLEGTGTEQYRGDIGGIAAKNLSENIYVAAVYSDGTTTWTSGVLGYSIGAYCGRLATNGGTIADLAMATAVYGYHAKAYFG